MARREDPPLSGVFRVFYCVATAVVLLLVVVSAIVSFYDPPDEDTGGGFGFDETFVQDDESRDDYNRNVSLILQITSAGVFATAIFGLGSRFNPLRAAMLLGGLGMFLTGFGFWASSSDQWVGFLTTSVNVAVLAIGFMWLEEGLPLGPTGEVRRLDIPPAGAVPAAAPAATPPPPPPPPPPPFSPPPRTMPPEAPDSTPPEPSPRPFSAEPPEAPSEED